MSKTIDVPPFPPLTWDTYGWAGEVRLTSWAGFQSRRGAYSSVCATESSDGTVELTVDAEEESQPTTEQATAFRHLIDNEVTVADAIGRALLDYYFRIREEYLDTDDLEESGELLDVRNLTDLRSVVGLSSVHVMSLAQDGIACVGFEFGCAWDKEHGAGVMTHGGE